MDDVSAALRAAMVRELRALDAITSGSVERAVAAVPRHLFAPGEPLEAAYAADHALVIKHDEDGTALSSLSSAHIQAVMLEQAAIEPGMRVLEVGSGGYNAALMAELVGDSGRVFSVDIDAEIVDRARRCLDAAGYEHVEVVLGDAENGVADAAPFDRIVVTAGAWDIPPAWAAQLATGGRMVVPLRLKGTTRSIAFEPGDEARGEGAAGTLTSVSYRLSGFVPMQGDGAYTEQVVHVGDDWALRVDVGAPRFDVARLRAALEGQRVETWPGATFDLPDELELFLLASAPNMVLLHARDTLISQGVFAPSAGRGVPVLVAEDGSFAYRTKRENTATETGFEAGVLAHGPQAEHVADQYAQLLLHWARQHRRRGAATIRYIPTAAAPADPAGPTGRAEGLVPKRHGTVTVGWS
ncbi:methyltransferase, FxLD system [Actinomadura sp. LOL_016]|uniref:methyltransferase, FxLD system n=1 Tax=unclassified Actinomadura TaxID=2626254 RepID=UPI003A7FECD9